METRKADQDDQLMAVQKLGIIRQQELAALLVRERKPDRARQARARLIAMLNELDVMEERAAIAGPGARAA